MRKNTKNKPHVYRVGQRAEYQLALAGKVKSIVVTGKVLVVTKVFPFKQPRSKMVAGKRGGGVTPIVSSPDACSGQCADNITFNGHNYAWTRCSLSGSASYASVKCYYKRVRP
jgi:hypothetical protein